MNIDHLVLWVEDPIAALDFYCRILGLTPVRAEAFERGEAPFPSVRVDEATIIDLMAISGAAAVDKFTGGTGSATTAPLNHLCLSMDAATYEAIADRLNAADVILSSGGPQAFGARGAAEVSSYFRDPDGNVIEIRYYIDTPPEGDPG